MSALSIQVPFPVFQDRDGQPLDNGYVWLGTSSLNPQTNPVVAYYDSALTIVATQPLRTLNGFISRAGSPAQVYVDAVNFSILVQDSKGTTVFSVPEGTGISPNASGVVYDPAGTGAVATTVQGKLRERLSVKDFGATGDGSTDDQAAIQLAITAGKAQGKDIFFPSGIYSLRSAITNLTSATLASDPSNGVRLIGEYGTILRAHSSFPASASMVNLDGNVNNESATANAVIQQYNHVESIEFDGAGYADRGLRLRANRFCVFKDLHFHDFAGGSNDAAIFIYSTATAGTDDVDTTSDNLFENIRIDTSTGYGVLGNVARTGSMKFVNCDIRNCTYDGMRLAFAGLVLDNCTMASNGSAAATTLGGFSAVKAASGALNRGLVIMGGQYENNFNHEINIDHCAGFEIVSGITAPYVSAAATQDVFRFGTGSDTVSGGVVSGFRFQNYSAGAHVINGFNVGANASNIAFMSNSFFLDAGTQWTTATQYSVNASATGITKDGYAICLAHVKPCFMAWATTNAGSMAALVNGVDFYTGLAAAGLGWFATGGAVVNHNYGGGFISTGDATGGVFVAPHSGFYEFGVKFSVRGFDATQTGMEVVIIVDKATSPVRYVISDTQLDGYTAGDTEQFGGTIQIRLVAGQTVVGAIKVTGGAASALIDRVKQGACMFWGRAF